MIVATILLNFSDHVNYFPLWYLVKNPPPPTKTHFGKFKCQTHFCSTGLVLYFSEMGSVRFLLVDVISIRISIGWRYFNKFHPNLVNYFPERPDNSAKDNSAKDNSADLKFRQFSQKYADNSTRDNSANNSDRRSRPNVLRACLQSLNREIATILIFFLSNLVFCKTG